MGISRYLHTALPVAALALGICFLSGCGGDSSTSPDTSDIVRQPEGDVNGFWEQFDWTDLTAAEQAAWGALGWDKASWQGEAEAPASEAKAWGELTDSEREAAERLGYYQEYWDS